VRTAAEPGQTLNVDLCFVPARHEAEQKLPAVSGSSGRLVVEQIKEEPEEKDWPGRVFEDESRDYCAAMLDFVTASRAKAAPSDIEMTVDPSDQATLQAQPRVLRQEEEELRVARRSVRQQRQQEDATWRAIRAERRREKAAQREQPAEKRHAQEVRCVRCANSGGRP